MYILHFLPILLPFLHNTALALATESTTTTSHSIPNIGFDPALAAAQTKNLSSHSWEYGTASQALLELYTPNLSVFSPQAFPDGHIPKIQYHSVPSLLYASHHIRLNASTLIDGDGATGDPASLGVSALLIGQNDPTYLAAAQRQYLSLETAPRWDNAAISHREASVELWADFIFMGPPFMAYYAVQAQSVAKLRDAVEQCGLYREILQIRNSSTKAEGVDRAWRHIMTSPPGGQREDLGVWSTGNAWAAMGMARVLGTVVHWEGTRGELEMQGKLLGWVGEILGAAVREKRDERGLLRNYWGEKSWFGEVSGSASIVATVYRVAVLQEEMRGRGFGGKVVTPEMLRWADHTRVAVAACVDEHGIASPTVNPLGWGDRTPYTKGSPEGQSFLVMMYAAWRDCREAGVCHGK